MMGASFYEAQSDRDESFSCRKIATSHEDYRRHNNDLKWNNKPRLMLESKCEQNSFRYNNDVSSFFAYTAETPTIDI